MFSLFKLPFKNFTGIGFSNKFGTSAPASLERKWTGETILSEDVSQATEQNAEFNRQYARNDIVTGTVVEHIRQGIQVQVPGGEVGTVVHAELDWSPKLGKKYFPIGTEVTVMVMTRKPNHSLYLSIKRANFHEYFEKSMVEFPIGKQRMCKVVAIKDYGLFVNLKTSIDVFFHKDRLEAFDRFQLGDLVEIKVTGYDMERSRIVADLV